MITYVKIFPASDCVLDEILVRMSLAFFGPLISGVVQYCC